MPNITVNRALCGKCGLCTFVCPEPIYFKKGTSVQKLLGISKSELNIVYFHYDKKNPFFLCQNSYTISELMSPKFTKYVVAEFKRSAARVFPRRSGGD